ncbi:hypothetical protein CBR_g724 [Chara braunii]|uniref:V-type proton ATPase subunit C n=1 Tax=Chara braunii TaxID=69332 RepID=A0A388KC09_CHABU|nr:hypothetical protein CBR_g724 [Chara braunii]|eukprot:GBG67595.1 hypothetical protein CBR_g724 [Chara braunii]
MVVKRPRFRFCSLEWPKRVGSARHTRFLWDEAKYPTIAPLRETVDSIHENVTKLEDDLKMRLAEYNNVKGQLATMTRKATGSLSVRDLTPYVKDGDVVSSEHLITLLVVVPRYSEKDWLQSYEKISTFVVPRSSKKLFEDNEYGLFTVTLFRKIVDTFKGGAREKGFQVREFEHDPQGAKVREEEVARLQCDQENLRSQLLQWCSSSYGEVFSSWMHVCAVRVFAESILRYGLPPHFVPAVVSPSPKYEKKLRQILESIAAGAGNHNAAYWKSGGEDASMSGLVGGESDLHPYVSITVNLAA